MNDNRMNDMSFAGRARLLTAMMNDLHLNPDPAVLKSRDKTSIAYLTAFSMCSLTELQTVLSVASAVKLEALDKECAVRVSNIQTETGLTRENVIRALLIAGLSETINEDIYAERRHFENVVDLKANQTTLPLVASGYKNQEAA